MFDCPPPYLPETTAIKPDNRPHWSDYLHVIDKLHVIGIQGDGFDVDSVTHENGIITVTFDNHQGVTFDKQFKSRNPRTE